MKVCIIMPVSRPEHLPAVFASLEMIECDRNTTGLVVLVDGDLELLAQTQQFVENSNFASRVCHHRKFSKPVYSKQARRIRIATVHNELRLLVPPCDYVFGIEDDGSFRPDALQRLLGVYLTHPFAGLATGVEIGRWGFTSLGLYRADDVYEPTEITSVMPEEGVEEIDACGMYGFLTRRVNYVNHDFRPFGEVELGPDVEWTLCLRQAGLKNYVDYDVWVGHRTANGVLARANTTIQQVKLSKEAGRWRQEVVYTP